MVTIATGPTPPRPSPFSALGQVGGALFARHRLEQARAAQARNDAEALLPLIAPAPGQRPNPIDAAVGRVSPPQVAPPQVAATGRVQRPDDQSAPPPDAPGSARTPDDDPEIEAMQHVPGGIGEQFQRMSREQQIATLTTLRRQGVTVPELFDMFGSDPAEFGFVTLGGRLFRTDPRAGTAEPVAGADQSEKLSTDQLRARLVQQVRSGEITREEFDRTITMLNDPSTPFEYKVVGNNLVRINAQEGTHDVVLRGGAGGGPVTDLSPDEVTALGLPEGTVAQRKADGTLVIVHEPGGQSTNQRQQEIEALTRDLIDQGVPAKEARTKAVRVVDGLARVEVSEDGRTATLIDDVEIQTGQGGVSRLQIRLPEQPERTEIPFEDTLMALAPDATGPSGSILSATGRIPGTEPNEAERRAINARRTFELTENELARGLVVNPKFPVGERKAVIDSLSISPSFFDTTEAMRARLVAARRFLTQRLAQAERDAGDESLPEDVRSAQSANASAMRNAIDRIGPTRDELGQSLNASVLAEMGAEQGAFVVGVLTPQEAAQIVNNASDEELEQLDESVRATLARRMQR